MTKGAFMADVSKLDRNDLQDVAWLLRQKVDRLRDRTQDISRELLALSSHVDPAELSIVILGPDHVKLRVAINGDTVKETKPGELIEAVAELRAKLEMPPASAKPQYELGARVSHGSEGSGRIQGISLGESGFQYRVKWDVGREGTHTEAELHHEELPTHYP